MDTVRSKISVQDSMYAVRSFVQRYGDLFGFMNDAVAVLQLDGVIIVANDAMATLTGCSIEELQGMNIACLLSIDDFRKVVDRQEQQIKGEAVTQRYELVWIRKDGAKVIGESVTRLIGEQGRPAAVLTIVKNITEQKRVQEALRKERDRAQRYLDVAGVAIQVIDANQTATLTNKKCSEMLGYKEGEVVGKNWFDTFTPERNRARAKAIFTELISGQIGLSRCVESPVLTKTGQERIISWYNTTLLKDEAGNTIGVLGSGEDITERRRMEKALLESEERYRTLFEDSRDAIFILDKAGRVIDANEAALGLLEYSKQEVAELYLLQRAVNATERENFLEQIGEKGYLGDYEMKMRKKDGSEIYCLLTFTAERNADGDVMGYEGIVRDVTTQKRMERSLSLYITQVTKAQEEERKRIARELHDDTVQALSALSLDIQRIGKGRKRLPDETTRELEQVRQKVTNIAEELSHLSRALRPSVLDHLGLIPALKSLTSDLSGRGKVSVSVEVAGTERRLSPEVELGLFRIAQEAIRNVRKHSEATTAVVAVRFDPIRVTVTINDNGKGFDIPARLDDLSAMGRLGLVGMQERAQLLNGELTVHSKLGVGTTIEVEIKCPAQDLALTETRIISG